MADINEAKSWLAIATRDISVAKHLFEVMRPMPVEVVCFHSQQVMSNFAVAVRYVEDNCDITEDTADFAIKQAEQAMDMVCKYLDSNEQATTPQ